MIINDTDKSQEQSHRSVIEKLWNRLFHKLDKEVADLTEEIYKKKLNDYGA